MNHINGKVVAIVGVDGVGKSTLAASLTEKLTHRGLTVRSEWCGFQDWLVLGRIVRSLRRVLRIDLRVRLSQPSPKQLYDANRGIFRNEVARFCYYGAVTMDHAIQLIIKVAFPKKEGLLVLCDRYYLDQAISISTELESHRAFRFLIRLYDTILPKPDMVFLVTAPSAVSLKRKSDVPGMEYLEKRAVLYPSEVRRYPHIEIDGRRDADENAEIMTDALVAHNLIPGRGADT